MEMTGLIIALAALYPLAFFLKWFYNWRIARSVERTICPNCAATRTRVREGPYVCAECGSRFYVTAEGGPDPFGFLHTWGLVVFGLLLVSVAARFLVRSGPGLEIADGGPRRIILMRILIVVGVLGMLIGTWRLARPRRF